MSDHEDKNETMPDPREVGRKLGQEVAGALREMFESLGSLMNSSSPTPGPTGSPSENGTRSDPKHSETDESPDSSSSSETGPSFTSPPLSETDPILAQELRDATRAPKKTDRRNSSIERTRYAVVELTVETYGTKEQQRKTVDAIVRDLDVKGYKLNEVELNGKIIRSDA